MIRDLSKQIIQGIKWNSTGTFLLALGGIVQLYLLVRYVDKADFGLMAVINLVSAFASQFLDMGISAGIIHKQAADSRQLSTLYWLNVIIGFLLAGIIFFSSGLIAWIYEENQLGPLLRLMALVFILNGIGQQFRILLHRNMRFAALVKIDLAVFAVGFSVVVGLAVKGWGVWALLGGVLARAATEMAVSLFFGLKIFKPNAGFYWKDIRFFQRFGAFQLGERLVNYATTQMDVLLIGKFLGLEALGAYDVIKRFLGRFFAIINSIISRSTLPAMARIQEDKPRLAGLFMRQLYYVCSLNFPLYLLLVLNAGLIVPVYFGPGYTVQLGLFQLLSLYFLLYSTGNPVGVLLLALGKASAGFYWNLVIFALLVPVMALGLQWGLTGLASALLILQALLVLPNYLFQIKPHIPAPWKPYFRAMGEPLIFAIAGMALARLMTPVVPLNTAGMIAALCWQGFLFAAFALIFNRQIRNDLLLFLKRNPDENPPTL